ncbi:hypothetical protein [Flavobacterium sp. B17]|uniref:hypothetical protein n=1 Tax=Flavobacterium sp. B17 TaxID=95618 RepID=UPI000348F326|nr:hypothetical protein [Flavobacterium sp. B17]
MKDSTIQNIGKFTTLLSFVLGNIFLFGYIFTKNIDFAIFGYLYLFAGTAINLLIIGILLLYGFFNKRQFSLCRKSALILTVNIPIALLYSFIGFELVKL